MRNLLVTVLTLFLIAGSALAAGSIRLDQTSYDFGSVGIDYSVYRVFKIYNAGDSTLIITGAKASCDCSTTSLKDTAIAPGDSTTVTLKFGTRQWYGDTQQYFTISSNDPKHPEIDIPYNSNVGKWIKGAYPEPTSLFFLPGQKAKDILLPNDRFDETTVKLLDQANDFFKVELVKASAEKGEKLQLKVWPIDPIPSGTHDSNFRIQIDADGQGKPILITIPVKIVRY